MLYAVHLSAWSRTCSIGGLGSDCITAVVQRTRAVVVSWVVVFGGDWWWARVVGVRGTAPAAGPRLRADVTNQNTLFLVSGTQQTRR